MNEIEELVASYVESVNQLDLRLAESLWSSSQDTSFIHPRGHERGWEAIKAKFYLETMGAFKSRKLEIVGELSINTLETEIAWGEFYWQFNAIFKDGTPLHTEGRETQIWGKNVERKWVILHVHYSAMPVTGEREGF